MSILEIVLYSIIGLAFIIWLIKSIKKIKKKKNTEEQDDLE